jgi:hypothetical protein
MTMMVCLESTYRWTVEACVRVMVFAEMMDVTLFGVGVFAVGVIAVVGVWLALLAGIAAAHQAVTVKDVTFL